MSLSCVVVVRKRNIYKYHTAWYWYEGEINTIPTLRGNGMKAKIVQFPLVRGTSTKAKFVQVSHVHVSGTKEKFLHVSSCVVVVRRRNIYNSHTAGYWYEGEIFTSPTRAW